MSQASLKIYDLVSVYMLIFVFLFVGNVLFAYEEHLPAHAEGALSLFIPQLTD